MRPIFGILACAFLINTPIARADIEVDKKAGNCIGYMAALQKESGMRAALSMADNQKRAMMFADNWLRDMKKYQGNRSTAQGMVYSANSDCREIGIKPSNY